MKSYWKSCSWVRHCEVLLNFNLKTFCATTLASLALAGSLHADPEKISLDLARAIENGADSVPVIVMMRGAAMIPHTMAMQLQQSDIEKLIKQRAMQLQSSMRDYVKELAGTPGVMGDGAPMRRYKFFWTVNALMATVTSDVVNELSDRDDVSKVVLDRRIKLEKDYRTLEEPEGAFTYGLEKIGVPELRSKHPELTGKGVTVGVIDTGVDASHPEFKDHQIIFKDFVNNQTEAYDDNGHGTHVCGTISGVGANGTQIGIAPEVKLVVAKVFSSQGGASESTLLRAMEWMADPSVDGEGKNRPKVVNNSWGGGIGANANDDPFFQATLTWVQLEIFPSFAAGNEGPGASTVGSPGGLPPAFAIGATDSRDAAASFSSRGPVEIAVNGQQMKYVKPDVSAPGVAIISSMPGGRYGKMSGTSMATPHNTGVVALIYQAKPDLKIAQVRELLSKTAQHLGDNGMNNTFGAGRISISAAIDQMEELGLVTF